MDSEPDSTTPNIHHNKSSARSRRSVTFFLPTHPSSPSSTSSSSSIPPPSTLPFPLLSSLTESPYLYRSEGYHPLHPGATLSRRSRYRIINKLGHGPNSTVWLAHDSAAVHRPWKALKIPHTMASIYHIGETLYLIWQKDLYGFHRKICLGRMQLAIPTDRFYLSDDKCRNGGRAVLVFPLLGPRVDDESYTNYLADLETREEDRGKVMLELKRGICHRVADALESLHWLGLCHGGLTTENILFQIDGLEKLTEEEITRVYGTPRGWRHNLPLYIGDNGGDPRPRRPQYLTLKSQLDPKILEEILAKKGRTMSSRRSSYWGKLELQIPKVALTGLGGAFRFEPLHEKKYWPMREYYEDRCQPGRVWDRDWVQDRRENLPKEYTAPEVLLRWGEPGPESEVWALGVLFCKVFLGILPFTLAEEELVTGWDPEEKLTFERLRLTSAPQEEVKGKWELIKSWEAFCGPIPAQIRESIGEEEFALHGLGVVGGNIWEPMSIASDVPPTWETTASVGLMEGRLISAGIPVQERYLFMDLLHKIFVWEPARRLTVTEVLEHAWFRDHRGSKVKEE